MTYKLNTNGVSGLMFPGPVSNLSISSSSLFTKVVVDFCDSGFVMVFLNFLTTSFPTADLPMNTLPLFSNTLVSMCLPSAAIAHSTSNE